jgi:hypothetical protein
MTQIFMLRIRLRKCQGGVLGGLTLPIFEALTDNPIGLKHTGWTECGEVRIAQEFLADVLRDPGARIVL